MAPSLVVEQSLGFRRSRSKGPRVPKRLRRGIPQHEHAVAGRMLQSGYGCLPTSIDLTAEGRPECAVGRRARAAGSLAESTTLRGQVTVRGRPRLSANRLELVAAPVIDARSGTGSDLFDCEFGFDGVGDLADVCVVRGHDRVSSAGRALDHGDVNDVIMTRLAGERPYCFGLRD